MIAAKLLEIGNNKLKESGIKPYRLESELILESLLSDNSDNIFLYSMIIDDNIEKKYSKLIDLRSRGFPLAYTIGYQHFYGRKFWVNPGVFIPRYDSELIICATLNILQNHQKEANSQPIKVFEWGIGSGAIIITLALEYPCASYVGVDINPLACDIARINRGFYDIHNKVNIIEADGMKYSENLLTNSIDILISNPPYLRKLDWIELSYETRKEPYNALIGGENGLEMTCEILRLFFDKITVRGKVILEADNCEQIVKMSGAYGYVLDTIYRDLSGFPRVVVLKKGEI